MDLFILLIDDKHNPSDPGFKYKGKLLQHGLMKRSETRLGRIIGDYKDRMKHGDISIFTSYEVFKNTYKIHVYVSGKRVTSKTILKEKTLFNESTELINAIIMDIKLGHN